MVLHYATERHYKLSVQDVRVMNIILLLGALERTPWRHLAPSSYFSSIGPHFPAAFSDRKSLFIYDREGLFRYLASYE